MDAEIKSLILRPDGYTIRCFQQYFDFIMYRKKTMYEMDRDRVAKYVFNDIRLMSAFKEEEVGYAELTLSLIDVYYEYRYGIFA